MSHILDKIIDADKIILQAKKKKKKKIVLRKTKKNKKSIQDLK